MNIKEIETRIEKIKKELLKIDGMRPGSLSEQYNTKFPTWEPCDFHLWDPPGAPATSLTFV
jgi:hypothetical protein